MNVVELTAFNFTATAKSCSSLASGKVVSLYNLDVSSVAILQQHTTVMSLNAGHYLRMKHLFVTCYNSGPFTASRLEFHAI